jgi:hypothetical protein
MTFWTIGFGLARAALLVGYLNRIHGGVSEDSVAADSRHRHLKIMNLVSRRLSCSLVYAT